MKIAYFLDFPHWIGGSNKVLLTQAYIMRKRGHETIVVIPNDENGHAIEYDEICKNYGLNTITAKYLVSMCIECIDIESVFKDYNGILQLLRTERVDLIHSTQVNVTVEMVARELQIPHLMNIYQTDLETFNIKWIDVYPHYHSADSEFFCQRWKNGLYISSKCIRVAYETDNKAITNEENNMPLRLLCIGVFREHKNQLEVIKLVSFCKENGIQVILTLLGDDKTTYGQKCKDFVKHNNLEKEVIFQGFALDVEKYFRQADLMILASKVESFPGVIVESMANKVPILSTPVAGVPELLRNQYNAFLTKGFCVQDMYEAFKCYIKYKTNGSIKNIVDHAYETYIHNHLYKLIETQLEEYYHWILKDFNKEYPQVQIDYIEKLFKNFDDRHCLNEVSSYTKGNLWYLYHINREINLKKIQRVVIWGAGFWGKIALEWIKILNCENRLIGFIDTYKKGEYLGYPIIKAREQIIFSCDIIFLAVGNINYRLEIMKYLDDHGKERNKDYFMILNEQIRI